MDKIKLSVPNKENHYAMWNWLAENPTESKYRWPGHETIYRLGARYDVKGRNNSTCFLCMESGCNLCPLSKLSGGGCLIQGPYHDWGETSDSEERTRLALIIRDCWK